MDHVAVMDIDQPGDDGLYGLRTLEITGAYQGASGGKEIDVHGFDIEILSQSKLRFWMINHRPPVNEAGQPLDAKIVGANSTVEVFDLARGSAQWNYAKTVADDAILTPNNIATTGDGGFVVTNDHTTKTGTVRLRCYPIEKIPNAHIK